ncbi:MAG: hypothetical protein FJY65_07430 [Calditrichaeota bacterium]|nr:hypothetical protein [Calditrichota bacterium]
MTLLPIRQPRRFEYKPRSASPSAEKHRIAFRRITLFDPHQYTRYPRVMVILLTLLLIVLWLLGGPRKLAKPFKILSEDIVQFR